MIDLLTGIHDFDTGELLKHYCSLHMTSGSFYDPSRHMDISFEDFSSHKFILTFDLSTQNHVPSDALPMVTAGELRAHLRFSTGLTTPMNMILFGISPALLKINQNRQISLSHRV